MHDGQDYAIKFFTRREAFDREAALYDNAVLRDMMPAVRAVEPNADLAHRSHSGWVRARQGWRLSWRFDGLVGDLGGLHRFLPWIAAVLHIPHCPVSVWYRTSAGL